MRESRKGCGLRGEVGYRYVGWMGVDREGRSGWGVAWWTIKMLARRMYSKCDVIVWVWVLCGRHSQDHGMERNP